MTQYCMYMFVNRRLNMSHGKMGAQCGHAVVYSLIMTPIEVYQTWLDNMQIKIVLQAENESHLAEIKSLLESKGLRTHEVHDAGKTELQPNAYTALAVQIVDKDDESIKAIFKQFKTYKEEK